MAAVTKINNTTANSSSSANSASPANVTQFNIRVPKNTKKKHHVMRFNDNLNVNFQKWNSIKLERENNMKNFKGMDEDMPKFGAGSEYNRDLREEIRRKKLGIVAKNYRPEAQPWILKEGGKGGKKFKGIREGGIGENSAYYVFTHTSDGEIEAYPLQEWYNFQPVQRYKALTAEEAEEEFGRRKKVFNYFSLMMRKRLRGDNEEEENDPEEKFNVKGGSNKKSKELRITEMDDWIDSDDDSDSDDDEESKKKKKDDDSDDETFNKKGKKCMEKKQKKTRNLDDEAFEESDDGDEEGREMDYDSDSSEDELDPEAKFVKDMKGVAEEDALHKLLTSDDESDVEEKTDKEKKNDESVKDNNEKKKKENKKDDATKNNKENKNLTTKVIKKTKTSENSDSSSDFTTDSSDSEDDQSNGPKNKTSNRKENKSNEKNNGIVAANNKLPISISANEPKKRKLNSMLNTESSYSTDNPLAKHMKSEIPNSMPTTFPGVMNNKDENYGVTEEDVIRYLKRKPLTATDLIAKLKKKKTGVSSDHLMEAITRIVKKINPVQHTIQGKMYLFLK